MGFLQLVEPERWSDPIDPLLLSAPAWASCVFGGSETAVALLTSPPGLEGEGVIDNGDIAAAREVVDRYAGSEPGAHPHDRPPEPGRGRARAHGRVVGAAPAGGVEGVHAVGSAGSARPAGGSSTTTPAPRSSSGCEALGPRIVCAHKGLAGPIPSLAPAAASPRDVGPAAEAHPGVDFVVYHSGYDIDAGRRGGRARRRPAAGRQPAGVEPRRGRRRPRARTCGPSSGRRGS